MYICTTGVGRCATRARALSPARAAPRRPRPALGLDRRARHGDHARARRVRARRGRRVRHPVAVARGRRAARRRRPRAALPARRDPRRAWPPCSTSSPARRRSRCSSARPTCPSRPSWPARRRSWASTRCTWPTRASSWPSWRPRRADAALAALRAAPGGEQAAEIGEVRTEPPRDGADGDRLRRQARDGHAGRRPAAEDLLRAACTSSRSPRPSWTIAARHARGRARRRGCTCRSGTCARSSPTALAFAFELCAHGHAGGGRRARAGASRRRACACRRCGAETEPDGFPLRLRGVRRARRSDVVRGEELLVESLDLEELAG